MEIEVRVRPNSGKREIIEEGDKLKVYLKSTPENNKANEELIKLLRKHFKKDIRIISGKNSRRKIVKIGDGN